MNSLYRRYYKWVESHHQQNLRMDALRCLTYNVRKVSRPDFDRHPQNYSRVMVDLDNFDQKLYPHDKILTKVQKEYENTTRHDFPDFRMMYVASLILYIRLFMKRYQIRANDVDLIGWHFFSSVKLLYLDFRIYDPNDYADDFLRQNILMNDWTE